jgi:adenylate cyclase
VPSKDDAKSAGKKALSGLRGAFAQGVARLLGRDPALLAEMVEVGLVRKEFLDDPSSEVISTATPMEMVERWMERSAEQRPSLLGTLGLNAIQLLSSSSEGSSEDGAGAPLTVVFTDLEGFTSYTAREGDEAASQLLAAHHREVGPVIRSRGGHITKRLGDGLLLTFPSPEAAVLAALELVAAQPSPLRLRAGMHLGDVVATRDDVIGHVVNVAARVAESAQGGEVLVTSDVRDAAGDVRGVKFSRARGRSYKGIGERVLVCRATRDTD